MAYFNHAFQKAFLASGVTQSSFDVTFPDGSTVATTTDGGYVITTGVPTYGLNLNLLQKQVTLVFLIQKLT
jgi:hypothetical protein